MPKTSASKTSDATRQQQPMRRRVPGPANGNAVVSGLQRTAGNRAVSDLLRHASLEPSLPLAEAVRAPIEEQLGVNLESVRVHAGSASRAAADGLAARAYTIGRDIHLGSAALEGSPAERQRVLTHEAIHALQQGGRSVPLAGTLGVSEPGDRAEVEARGAADELSHSPALALRHRLRLSQYGPAIHRDITGKQKLRNGELKIAFVSTDGTVAGDAATEDGTVTFTPNATAPESDAIKFIQIVRTVDIGGTTAAAGAEVDWAKVDKGAEAPRNQQMTKTNAKANVAGGFYVDQNAASLAKRTKKADPAVSPFYDVTGPPIAGNATGKRKGKTIDAAVLKDTPGTPMELDFKFVTSAKAADTGFWYGTVLWGFGTRVDKKGITRIKNEYRSFREFEGETTEAALRKFNEFYQNPGTPAAPTK